MGAFLYQKNKKEGRTPKRRGMDSIVHRAPKIYKIPLNHVLVITVCMEFFNSAIEVLETLVIALGAGLGVWGLVNLLEGYGNDNPGAKSQGMKQLMAGAGVCLIAILLIPQLSGLFG
jgi:hypothetical protein